MRICLVTAEFAPLAKAGGLADVCSALAHFLHRRGHDLRVLLPRYDSMDTSGLRIEPVDYLQNVQVSLGPRECSYSIDLAALPGSGPGIYLLRCPELYGRPHLYTVDADEHQRFVLLSQAAITLCQHMSFAPDIFHCHDWHTGLVPLYLKSVYAWDRLFSRTRSVLTIHNAGYQGVFDASVLADLGLEGAEHMLDQEDLAGSRINFLKTGLLHADLLTTVSPGYAREIQGEEYGMGLQGVLRARSASLQGILNGVDYSEWNPATDSLIPRTYSAEKPDGKVVCKRELMKEMGLTTPTDRPVIGMVTRLTSQKGTDLVQRTMPALLQQRDFALAVLGSGEAHYEQFFHGLARTYPGRVAFHRGYSDRLAHRIEAGSDMFLMPSLYEPCGLNQMYSLRYGTVPIVRLTGGLADSVQQYDPESGEGDGVVFRDYDETGLRWALAKALELYENRPVWRRIMQNGMRKDFSWDRQGARYVEIFRQLISD